MLENSLATAEFRRALEQFRRDGRPNERINFELRCPPVKIDRTLTKLLREHPDLPIESVEINATSGCEFFRGTAVVQAGFNEHRIRFYWDCRWKAEQQGWTDYFGFPDQMRAAREFGYDCFRQWEMEGALSTTAS